jgi:hypothetical protein
MLTLLKRLEKPTLPAEDMAFVQEVRSVLGFEILDNPHTEIFDKIGLYPFTEASVQEYKDAMIKKASAGQWSTKQTGIISTGSFLACVICIVLGMFCGVHNSVGLGWGLGGLAIFFLLCVIYFGSLETARKVYFWNLMHLKDYQGKVPEYALQTALDIRKYSKEGYIGIDHLEEHTDPFLVWRIGGKQYHLEVWNEPTYKQQRQV